MKGKTKVVDRLQGQLKTELTAVHQFLLHAEMCHNWGYLRLAEHSKSEAMEELGHAQSLMERILFLEGQPNMRELADLRIGGDVKSQFENDLALEAQTVPDLNESIAIATDEGDNTSRELFEKILIDEEEHVDWLEAQLGMIDQMGLGVYLSEQMRD